MVASCGCSVIKNLMFLNSISAGAGRIKECPVIFMQFVVTLLRSDDVKKHLFEFFVT